MFSTADRLAKRTPKEGIDRRTYISLLVDEYYETSNIGKIVTLLIEFYFKIVI